MTEPVKAFNVKQVAQLYRVTVQTVYRWIRHGRLRALRTPGGNIRVLMARGELKIIANDNGCYTISEGSPEND